LAIKKEHTFTGMLFCYKFRFSRKYFLNLHFKMKLIKIILVAALFLSLSNFKKFEPGGDDLYAAQPQAKRASSKAIFKEIEGGIAAGEVEKFSSYFSSQTYLSLSNGTSGYFSANQAFYVLQDYFKIHRTSSFRFVTIYEDGDVPFATGVYNHELRGRRSSAQVFVSLTLNNGSWKISQITFN
jgi:hypothetical protein